jgi:hypothetical protein
MNLAHILTPCFLKNYFNIILKSRYGDQAMDWTIEIPGFDSRQGLGIFIFTVSRPALGPTQPPIQWHLHLVPRSRMLGAIPPFPQNVFISWCLIKHRDNFTCYLTFIWGLPHCLFPSDFPTQILRCPNLFLQNQIQVKGSKYRLNTCIYLRKALLTDPLAVDHLVTLP